MSDQTTTPFRNNKGKIAIAAVVVLVVLYFVVSGVVNSRAADKVAEFVERIEQETDGEVIIDYEGVDASLFSESATLESVTISAPNQGEMFRVGSISVTMDGHVEKERIPDGFSLAVEDLRIVNEQLASEMSGFAGIDYLEHPMDFRLGYDYSEDDNELGTTLTWDTEDLSELSYEMTLSNVAGTWEAFQTAYRENGGNPEFSRQQQRAIQQQLQTVRFNHTHLGYQNNGEVELILGATARDQQMTADELKSRILDVVDQQFGDSEAARNVRDFIENPQEISLTIKPEQPLTMEELTQVSMMVMMGNSNEAVTALGLEVKAN